MSAPNGVVLWSGPSQLDGADIIVIATGLRDASSNRKTGGMVQTYILRSDLEPTTAVRTGADASICGDCPHRGTPGQVHGFGVSTAPQGRTCYVNVGQGPLGVWRAWKRGIYGVAGLNVCLEDIGRDRIVRLGTYGDPAAVPWTVWHALVRFARGHTGYTHQWRRAPGLRHLCMASADSVADAEEAQRAGWRTFRVAMPCDSPREHGEAVCPASKEAGHKLQCAQCLACGGANGRRGNIVIQAHGGFAVMANVRKRSTQHA